jgi:hypothetical protein
MRSRRPTAAGRGVALACLLGLLGSSLTACGGGPERVPLEPAGGALVEALRLRLERESDRAGMGQAWSLSITNAGPRELRDLVLVLDEGWSTPVTNLRVLDGASCAVADADGRTLGVGKTLVVRSSHDVANHFLFRNAESQPFPEDRVPHKVGVEAAGERGLWRSR